MKQNKLSKSGSVKCYGRNDAFQTYEIGYGNVQIRDNRPDKHRAPERVGIVLVAQTMGGQYATYQDHKQAVRLARKVVRTLNQEIS